MQALYLTQELSYRTGLSKPEIADGEALIRLQLAGICSTDLELVKGYARFSGIPGHEFVGVVEDVANETDRQWIGRRVVGTINIGCNSCDVCLREGPVHCLSRKVLGIRGRDGVFADYFSLPVDNLLAVPDFISDASAVFTEPLAAALRILDQIVVSPDQKVAVVGPGRLGLLIGKVLALSGIDVIMLGRSEASLALQWKLKTGKVHAVPDNSFACVVDASGQASGFEQALRIVKPRGTLILKSTFSSIAPVDLTKVVVSEVNIIGSRCGPFSKTLALLAKNQLPVESMIDGCYSLKDGIAAFEHAARPGVKKILLRP